MSEVFVADRAAFFGGRWPQGFVPLAPAAADDLLARAFAAGRFEPRAIAEETPAWKQWIPYCVLRSVPPGGASPDGVFCVRRTRGQSEQRLHGQWSIGLGGHIEPADAVAAPGTPFFTAALRRELGEELAGTAGLAGEPKLVGLLNDDASPVGQVHAGLVFVWDVAASCEQAAGLVQIAEISKMAGGFASLVEFAGLWQDPLQFETWSRFLVRAGIVGPMRG